MIGAKGSQDDLTAHDPCKVIYGWRPTELKDKLISVS
jgi:hypothetical protein